MSEPLRALVSNGTFREVLATHLSRLTAAGIEVIHAEAAPGVPLGLEQVLDLGRSAAVVFGPSAGLDGRLFAQAPDLRVVTLAASGYESVDLQAATESGIVVTNAPTPAGSEAVADLAFGLILSLARDIPARHRRIVADRVGDRTLGRAVFGRVLGIVGLGQIGKAVVRRAAGFGMRVLAWELDGFWDSGFAAHHAVTRVSLEELLRQSDFVSLHLRLSEENRGLLGARELAWMKPTAYLVNTARGGLVDEPALVEALTGGRLAGAGLDTILDNGPDSPLIGLPGVIGTPHLGNRVIESVHDVVAAAIDDAVAVLRGERPRYLVNPRVYEVGVRLPVAGARKAGP